MRSGNTAYIERLDHLRFFAAVLVLLFHSWLLTGGATRGILQIQIINQGQIGVQLFMLISGFIDFRRPGRGKIDSDSTTTYPTGTITC
jgi:peptidoglycan/LPS O-acetylase OafA/YrhL